MLNHDCNAGFVIHALGREHLKRRFSAKYPIVGCVREATLESLGQYIPSKLLRMGHIDELYSHVGENGRAKSLSTEFQALALTPDWMLSHPKRSVEMIVEAGYQLRRRGAHMVGLGAFTAIVGEQGKGQDVVALSQKLGHDTQWTTGNSLTTWSAVHSLFQTAEATGHVLNESTIGIVGATGSIGRACALMACDARPREILLCARDTNKLAELRQEILKYSFPPECRIVSREELIRESNLILAATSETSMQNLDESLFQPGAIVCDVSRPRVIAATVTRNDVLVYDGGLMLVPGADYIKQTVDLNLDRKGLVPACVAETMVLSLSRVGGNWSIGPLTPLTCKIVGTMALEHGFKLGGIRVNDQEVLPDRLDQMREAVEAFARR